MSDDVQNTEAEGRRRGLVRAGSSVISLSAIQTMVAVAAREVPGVHDLPSDIEYPPMSGLAQDVHRHLQASRSVKVMRDDHGLVIDLVIRADYGVELNRLAAAVRDSVFHRIKDLTDISARQINVEVADLHMADHGATDQTATDDASGGASVR